MVDGTITDTDSALLDAALAYWNASRSAGGLPSRDDIDPLDIPDLLPWISLIDVVREGARMRFRSRLVGTGVCDRFGRDITGAFADELYDGAYLRRLNEGYGAIVHGRQPQIWRCDVAANDDGRRSYSRVVMPLSSDGETVDMLFAAFDFGDPYPAPGRAWPQGQSTWREVG
ncbi:MAG: PAS domain-containing protein [Alphaproteobacteria bacterium]|jgi:hypothetical protein|nr:PAS domain-containing protein [Alphaproteobacteria bacterium]MDP6813149.1 PAS domain-containing protein [Alphaproteobacteria bacterium]